MSARRRDAINTRYASEMEKIRAVGFPVKAHLLRYELFKKHGLSGRRGGEGG